MKAKNLFFGALACLAFAACSNDDEPIVNGAQSEYACITVQFNMPGGSSTRAWNDDEDNTTYYKKGDPAEVAVTSARFFFFDAAKNKCLDPQTPASLGTATDGTNLTIDKIHGATIVLQDPSVTPAYIAVAINLPEGYKDINPSKLDELTKKLHDVSGTNTKLSGTASGTFVMTNSVYVNGTEVIQATPIEPAQIGRGKTPEIAAQKAKEAPVKIAVERVLARVHVEGTSTVGDESVTFSGSTTPTKIIPTIEGWWLDCTNKGSYLVKQLDASYTFKTNTGKTALPDGWWNDLGDSRSYWANAITTAGHGHYTYGTANKADKYCFENTDAASTTKLVVAATLNDEHGNPVNLIQWADINFNGADAFNQYMATYYLKDKYLKSTDGGSTKVALTKDDFTFIYNTDETGESTLNEKDWQTRLGVKNVSGTTYYLADGTPKTVAEMNDDELKTAVGIFKFYNEGQTYYFTEIQHEPVYQETDFAIIRNHYYALTIKSITGLGTPVPNPEDEPTTDPTDPYFPDPEDPDDGTKPDPTDDPEDKPIIPELPENDHSAIAAQVQILKYRIVTQDVELGK